MVIPDSSSSSLVSRKSTVRGSAEVSSTAAGLPSGMEARVENTLVMSRPAGAAGMMSASER